MRIGTVAALYRYPVKAMAAEELPEVEVGWHGLDGDRRYAFVQSDSRSDFPWLTIRELPALTTWTPLGGEPPQVRSPDGRVLALHATELAEELGAAHGGPVHLHRDYRGTQDAFPVSVMSLQTVAALGAIVGRELDPRRFRPSIVVDLPSDGTRFPEDALVGRPVRIGAARVRLNTRDKRCMVINFDPRTAERDPSVLRAVAQHREACLGVYGSCEEPGLVRVGDPVEVD